MTVHIHYWSWFQTAAWHVRGTWTTKHLVLSTREWSQLRWINIHALTSLSSHQHCLQHCQHCLQQTRWSVSQHHWQPIIPGCLAANSSIRYRLLNNKHCITHNEVIWTEWWLWWDKWLQNTVKQRKTNFERFWQTVQGSHYRAQHSSLNCTYKTCFWPSWHNCESIQHLMQVQDHHLSFSLTVTALISTLSVMSNFIVNLTLNYCHSLCLTKCTISNNYSVGWHMTLNMMPVDCTCAWYVDTLHLQLYLRFCLFVYFSGWNLAVLHLPKIPCYCFSFFHQ